MDKAVESPQRPEYDDTDLQGFFSSLQYKDDVPLNLSKYPDAFGSIEWDRLLPVDIDDPDVYRQYPAYLKKFYHLHKNPAHVSIADAAFKCLKKENTLRLYWTLFKVDITRSDAALSNNIFDFMLQHVQNGGTSQAPFVVYAAACIAKEAKLIMKFIRQGCKVPCSQYNLSRNIRTLAFKVAMFQGKWSPHIAAFLLGIIKEAELLLDENISGRYLDAIDTSDKIRRFALEFMGYELDETEIDERITSCIVSQPKRGLAREFEKNKLEKKCGNMYKKPKQKTNNSGSDISSLSKEGYFSSFPCNGTDYLSRKTIIATEYL